MIGIGMLATLLETIVNLMKAGIVAVFAVMDALVHLWAHVFVYIAHWWSFWFRFGSVDDSLGRNELFR